MDGQPRCSVVIPTYNSLELLKLAIATVRMQGIEDLEILVIDDASTDGTGEWLEHEAAKDLRIVALHTEHVGPSRARNEAISRARAPFVAFLDADDLWWPNKLSLQLAFHESNPDVAFSFTDYIAVDPRGEVRGGCFDYWKPAYVDRSDYGFRELPNAWSELLAANTVGTSTVVASRRHLHDEGFSSVSPSAQDWALWLRLSAIAPVAFSAATTMTYLMHDASVTANHSARIDAMNLIVDECKRQAHPPAARSFRRARSRIPTAEAERARALGDRWSAFGSHMKSLAIWPEIRTARAAAADLVAAFRAHRARRLGERQSACLSHISQADRPSSSRSPAPSNANPRRQGPHGQVCRNQLDRS